MNLLDHQGEVVGQGDPHALAQMNLADELVICGQPSPERAGDRRRIQYHQATLHQRQPASRVSAITPQQKDLCETVALPEPSARHL